MQNTTFPMEEETCGLCSQTIWEGFLPMYLRGYGVVAHWCCFVVAALECAKVLLCRHGCHCGAQWRWWCGWLQWWCGWLVSMGCDNGWWGLSMWYEQGQELGKIVFFFLLIFVIFMMQSLRKILNRRKQDLIVRSNWC